ncbi:65-kDa microtubule-associated protein 8 [Acorus calamus]|uniref:65-kDa microtubule-associated protein 8 n=1 Tax=Acorus calamus TaxID=4465 RepID=A0AAV9BZW4_ACOCL|nr:65-kDa microtubule-associated protein 8 [Acorus calamus]
MAGTLKEQLDVITPALREMQKKKQQRLNELRDVQVQIRRISAEIEGLPESDGSVLDVSVDESDLSLKKLDEYRTELQRLHREKNDRLMKLEEYTSVVRDLAATLGMNSSEIIVKVHPSLNDSSGQKLKNIGDKILERLDKTAESLKEEKQRRLEKLHKLGKALKNLWSLMDTSIEDQRLFSHVADFTSATAANISKPGSLAIDIIDKAEAEVERLDQLKARKMKEVFFKKQMELEEIYKQTHMEIPPQSEMDSILNLINSGEMDHADLIRSMDAQISQAKEDASSRNDIMEKIERWITSCDEERWLEEYNRDENRYSVSRGAHRNLKRAERARITVNKIPALVDSLIAKTKSWEEQREKVFLYDDIPLLAMLEEYNLFRREKEEEKQKQREKKRVQGKVMAEQENIFGSRPSTSNRSVWNRSLNSNSSPMNRRSSQQISSNSINSASKYNRTTQRRKTMKRTNNASYLKDDAASLISTLSGPLSP